MPDVYESLLLSNIKNVPSFLDSAIDVYETKLMDYVRKKRPSSLDSVTEIRVKHNRYFIQDIV